MVSRIFSSRDSWARRFWNPLLWGHLGPRNAWFHGLFVAELSDSGNSWFHRLWLTYPLIYAAMVYWDLVSLWIFDTTDPYFCKSTCMFDFRDYAYQNRIYYYIIIKEITKEKNFYFSIYFSIYPLPVPLRCWVRE